MVITRRGKVLAKPQPPDTTGIVREHQRRPALS